MGHFKAILFYVNVVVKAQNVTILDFTVGRNLKLSKINVLDNGSYCATAGKRWKHCCYI